MATDSLAFILCTPRSGSTLLQRMLGAHSQIYTHPEPHLLTPLYYGGYFANVDAAPYDHINAGAALRELCEELPRGEEDYLDALRAYARTVYDRVREPTGLPIFLDKTPAYGLVASFVAKLFPNARFVVLTRHPMAIWHSQAHSFFGGDYRAALETNPLVEPYLASLGQFLREKPVDFVHVRYEDLVSEPETHMRRILSAWDLPFEPNTVEYGNAKHISKSYGDPMSVEKHRRPVVSSREAWASDLKSRPDALATARALIKRCNPEDLAAWGYPLDSFWDALGEADERATNPLSRFNSYWLKRQVLLGLRRNIGDNALGNTVRRVRYYCDVLLRS
ncbi:MAG: sulfotransferase [Myxococcota bacterium]